MVHSAARVDAWSVGWETVVIWKWVGGGEVINEGGVDVRPLRSGR